MAHDDLTSQLKRLFIGMADQEIRTGKDFLYDGGKLHADEVADLIRKGRDCERLALARAVRLVLCHQVMVYRGRTAVFD
jgi:DNA recombination-dependent growth factor C